MNVRQVGLLKVFRFNAASSSFLEANFYSARKIIVAPMIFYATLLLIVLFREFKPFNNGIAARPSTLFRE